MAKQKKTNAAPAKKQTTEPTTPAPVAPTTAPENNPTVVPPVADPVTPETPKVEEPKAPVEKATNGKVDVEVANPFYDLEGNKNRKAGEAYQTTEKRAAELRGLKLIK